jgi:hypothetical protein
MMMISSTITSLLAKTFSQSFSNKVLQWTLFMKQTEIWACLGLFGLVYSIVKDSNADLTVEN